MRSEYAKTIIRQSEIYIYYWDIDRNVIKLGGVSKYLNVNVSLNWFKFERVV